jgi:nucleoside-diphosphate-sugar epimerase
VQARALRTNEISFKADSTHFAAIDSVAADMCNEGNAKKKILIAGVSGLVGYAAAQHFSSLSGWEVLGISRRPPDISNVDFVALDLLDARECRRILESLSDVTHVVYATVTELPGLAAGRFDPATIERNATMLRNLMEPLSAAAENLQHVSLLHGTKAYGLYHPSVDHAAAKSPLREAEPRREHPNFYFVQEDYLLGKQAKNSWGLTVWRPTVIYGVAYGNNMNVIPVLAAYAAILRERGEPLHFPGQSTSPAVAEAVDADLVARALAWAAVSPSARNQTFNLTNGDIFGWQYVWPAIADSFGMEVGEHRPLSLVNELPTWQQEWAGIVDKYQLQAPRNLMDFVGHNSVVYTDSQLLGADKRGSPRSVPILNSTIKIRQAGFHECMDTEEMFRKIFVQLREKRLIP